MIIVEISLAIIATYCVGVSLAIFIDRFDLSINIKRRGDNKAKKETNTPQICNDIMGKTTSLSRLERTRVDIRPKAEPIATKESTFVKQEEKTTQARMSDSEVEDAFIDARFESEYTEDNSSDIDLESEAEELADNGYDNEQHATGVGFNELNDAVKTAKRSKSSASERYKAGEVFKKIEGNDLDEKLKKTFNNMEEKIYNLLNYHTKVYNSNKYKQELRLQSTSKVDFDINQYI